LTGLDLTPGNAIKAVSERGTNRNAAKSAVLKQTCIHAIASKYLPAEQ